MSEFTHEELNTIKHSLRTRAKACYDAATVRAEEVLTSPHECKDSREADISTLMLGYHFSSDLADKVGAMVEGSEAHGTT